MGFDPGSGFEDWPGDGEPPAAGGGADEFAGGAGVPGPDAGLPDAGLPDAGLPDAGLPDAGAGGPVPVPEELDGLPPGAVLAELLDDISVGSVSGYDSVVVLVAAYRQLCRQQAVFYEALVETGLRAAGSAAAVARLVVPGEFACEEARAGLVWSRQRAQREYRLGFDLFVRFPQLGAALAAGRVDLPRARALIDWTEGLTDAQAAAIITRLLPEAAGMVVGALVDEIKRAAIAVDPEWAERRYRAAVKTRRVRGFGNADGTANLGGYCQPVDRVVAACHRIDTLARACKAAGDRRRLDLIRSDLYLRMLDGSFEAMTDDEIVAHVLAQPLDDLTATPDPTSDADDGDDHGGASKDAGGGDGDGGDGDGDYGGASKDAGGVDGDNDDDSHSRDGDQGGDGGGGGTGDGPASVAGEAARGQEPAGRDCRRGGAPPGVGRQVPELRVQLATLLGVNDAPGCLPGWGYLPAEVARELAGMMTTAEWRWVVCGADGHAIDAGLIAARPGGHHPARRDRRRGGIVEIAVTAVELHRLADRPERAGVWVPVVTDIHRQHSASTGGAGPGGRPGHRPEADRDDTGRRYPAARLRRWIQIRDRSCLHPCCRARATASQIDHRTPWAAGGPTDEHNLGPLCGHDHRVKDDSGWQLHQPAPAVHRWTSPLGHSITRRVPPVIPPATPRIDRDDGLPAQTGLGFWPDPCRCLFRPCPHDQQPEDSSGSRRCGTGDTPGSGAGGDPDSPPTRSDKPYTDRIQHQLRTHQALYDNDEPPF